MATEEKSTTAKRVRKPKSAKPRVKRVRRTTEEIIDRMMEAAVVEFQEKGFSGATTAAIARRAGVAEALIFVHFGSKVKLFQDAIFKPLSKHFDGFLNEHAITAETPAERRADSLEYIEQLEDFISSNSQMLLALVFAQCQRPGGVDGIAEVQGWNDYFTQAARQASVNLGENPRVDPEIMARISFISIMSCTLFQDWLFPDIDKRRDEVREAIGLFVMDGLNVNNRKD